MKARLLVFMPLPLFSVGGLQSHAREFNEEMAKRGYDITAFAPDSFYPAFELIPNYPIPKLWKGEFWQAWRRLPHAPNTIVISRTRFFFSCLMAWYFSWQHGLPWVHIEHGSDFAHLSGFPKTLARWYDRVLGKAVLRRATKVVANSQASANFVRQLSGRKDVEVIYRGINI